MPRPPRCRRICGKPQIDTFCPNGGGSGTPILLTLDEYEVIRLVDLEQRTHEQCAAQMALAEAGIKLYGGVSGEADAAVNALLASALAYDPNVRCDHHDHAHGEGGHTCGEHGCGHHGCH